MKKLILLLGVLTPLFLAAQNKPAVRDTPRVETQSIHSPEFAGGEDSLNSFLKNNLIYPAKAKAEKRKGTVYIGFVVKTNGELTKVQVEKRSLWPDLDEEALRVVKSMPKWLPAKYNKSINGAPETHELIDRHITLPITFTP